MVKGESFCIQTERVQNICLVFVRHLHIAFRDCRYFSSLDIEQNLGAENSPDCLMEESVSIE